MTLKRDNLVRPYDRPGKWIARVLPQISVPQLPGVSWVGQNLTIFDVLTLQPQSRRRTTS
jgi:hypothetical protein